MSRRKRVPTILRGVPFLCLLLFTAGVVVEAEGSASPDRALDEAFAEFFSASRPARERRALEAVLALDPPIEEVDRRLEAGPEYSAEVETGILLRTRTGRFHYTLLVPRSYDPTRRYPLSVRLHGGIARPVWRRDGSWYRAREEMLDDDRIIVLPAGWNEARWWHRSQVENLNALIVEIARSYNVDESRVHLGGVSDGGTGAFYHSMRAPDRWASFVSMIGHPAVLGTPATGAEGDLFPGNVRGRAFRVVNGELDPLYPAEHLVQWVDLWQRAGADVRFRAVAGAGHDLAWIDGAERAALRAFVDENRRDPWPRSVRWETSDPDGSPGAGGLEVLEVGPTETGSDLVSPHLLRASTELELPTDPAQVDGRSFGAAYRQDRPSGRVELVRESGRVELRTDGVRRLRLLLPLEEARDVEVVVDGRVVHRGPVETSVEGMLRRFLRDRDRTRRVAAELELSIR